MNATTSVNRTRNSDQESSDRCETPIGDGLGRALSAFVYAAILSLPIAGGGGWLVYNDYAEAKAAREAFQHQLRAHERLASAAPLAVLPVDQLVHGRSLFEMSCAACHRPDGTGVPGLGKDLTQSWFVAARDDAQLVAFINRGRWPGDPLNTTNVPMPPKGGHMELTDADLGDIVAYVRGLQDPRRMPALPAPAPMVAAAPTDAEKAQALAAAGGDTELAEYIAHGTKVFAMTCAACHGKDARGLPNQGKDLVKSEFARKLDDDALLAFIKRGRNPGDPLNTTKVDMPPKGGNPALSDDDLLDVIAYVRSLQKQSVAER